MSGSHDNSAEVQVSDLLRRLRAGALDVSDADPLEKLPVADFLQEIRGRYPVVFQERAIGRKTELGLAKSLEFQLAVPDDGRHTFVSVELLPILRNCLLVSLYDGAVSGIATTRSIRLRPSRGDEPGLLVVMGSGFKLDKMPDGWVTKEVFRKATVLSEPFLRTRGWKFEVFQPFIRTS
jgi:hypothetical protein